MSAVIRGFDGVSGDIGQRGVSMEIFTQDGILFLARWGHILAGITWIGLLYYFNLVQVPSFAQMDAGARTDAIRRLVPRALWWFRWAAVATWVFGATMLILDWQDAYDGTLVGVAILSGALLGTIMLANVWGVIWPNQKIVIANAETTAAGGQADPNAAAAGRKGFVASRSNVLLSVPMLFFMGAARHFVPSGEASGHYVPADSGQVGVYWLFLIAVAAVVELNALGILGGVAAGPLRRPLETVRDVIISGFVLAALIYLVGWEVILRAM